MDTVNILRSLLFVLIVSGCGVYSASAQVSKLDTIRHAADTSKVVNGKLPGLVSKDTTKDKPFVIRCSASLNTNEPLFILDGRKTSYSQFQTINVNNIKTISILKDSVAVLKYGKKARYGVIIITTQKNPAKTTSF